MNDAGGRDAAHADALEHCSEIANAPNVYALLDESPLGRLIFTAMCSRVLERPASLRISGPSSSGKCSTTERVLRLFREYDDYLSFSSMSVKALIDFDKDLRHRMIYLPERHAGANNSHMDDFIRTLLSEHYLRYSTVIIDPTSGMPQTVQIEKEGPSGLILTTTIALDAELETELLSASTREGRRQNQAVIATVAARAQREGVRQIDLESWHEFQRFLASGPQRAIVPFASALADRIDAKLNRIRRDFDALLSLTKTSALIHQRNREIRKGCVIATLDDYGYAREMVTRMWASVAEMKTSAGVRRVCEVVEQAAREKMQRGIDTDHYLYRGMKLDNRDDLRRVDVKLSVRQLAKTLDEAKSSAHIWLKKAVEQGYLAIKSFRGRTSRIQLDNELPQAAAVDVLPSVEQIKKVLSQQKRFQEMYATQSPKAR